MTAPATATEQRTRTRSPWWVFAAVSMCGFQTSLSLSIMNVAFPSLRDSFPDTSAASLSWVINLYTVVAASTLVISGVLGERIGRKRFLLTGVAGFACSSIGCALAPNVKTLLVFRGLQALSSALVSPVAFSLAVRAFDVTRQAVAIALFTAVGSVSIAAGPTLGALLIDWGGWQWAFWINLPGGALGFVLAAMFVAESKDPNPRPMPDLFGAVLIAVSVSSIVGALTQSRSWGWTDWRVLGLFGAGLSLGVWLVRRSLHHPSPILELSLIKAHNLKVANVASIAFGLGFFAMFFGFVLFLRDAWGYGVRDAGLLMTPIPICGAILSPSLGRAANRWGIQRVCPIGGAVLSAGAIWILIGARDDPNLFGVWFPATILIGLGTAAIWPCIYAGVVLGIAPDRYAVATGINQTVQRVATALAVAITVAILGDTANLGRVGNFRVVFAMLLMSGLLVTFIGSWFRYPESAAATTAESGL